MTIDQMIGGLFVAGVACTTALFGQLLVLVLLLRRTPPRP